MKRSKQALLHSAIALLLCIQIIYEGTKDDWDNKVTKTGDWDDNIGSNSIVICRENGVISGYYKKTSSYSSRWTWHDGAPDGFPRAEWDENGFPKTNS